jgi:hypothetical protein
MVNLRYHIVSLVAVFLALGMGIVMGSTVIDRVTVDALNNKLESVRNSVNSIREENSRLGRQVAQGEQFAEATRDQLLRGHLKGVPVLVVAVVGVDRKPVEDLRQALTTAQATLEGTVWLTSKMRLANDGDVRALASALDLAPGSADVVRRQALSRLTSTRDPAAADPGPVSALASAGFLTYDPPPVVTSSTSGATTTTVTPALSAIPTSGTRWVVVSGAGAEVGDEQVAVPLVQALTQGTGVQTPPRVVAAESGQDSQGGRAVFVGLLRRDATVSARLSTVDNLESPMGQSATVLALEDLAGLRVGQFGVGPGAQRLLPAAAA